MVTSSPIPAGSAPGCGNGQDGASVRDLPELAELAGRSYGFLPTLLLESGAILQQAHTQAARSTGPMTSTARLVVHPPDENGRRRVRWDGSSISVAHQPSYVLDFLSAARQWNAEGLDLTDPLVVQRRGGGPDTDPAVAP
ncbi:helix-turn-helix domain-containing protein [Streptomyces sp. NPDC058623]|uniref:helix-turn-helix domain-containing protein n=1 Tax=Streptomyces sp. NPDC058623 TaxID=3346563 RepID=UPI0036498662